MAGGESKPNDVVATLWRFRLVASSLSSRAGLPRVLFCSCKRQHDAHSSVTTLEEVLHPLRLAREREAPVAKQSPDPFQVPPSACPSRPTSARRVLDGEP